MRAVTISSRVLEDAYRAYIEARSDVAGAIEKVYFLIYLRSVQI